MSQLNKTPGIVTKYLQLGTPKIERFVTNTFALINAHS